MQTYFIISVRAKDRTGIVYEIASTIRDMGGDIDDSRQSVLKGYFTMILLVAFPTELSAEAVQDALSTPDIHVGVNQIPADELEKFNGDQDQSPHKYILTASGADRIGLVADVAGFCTQNGINIDDLTTMRQGTDYVMMCLVDVQNAEPLVTIRWNLKRFSEESGLKTTLQHQDIFKAINEIS